MTTTYHDGERAVQKRAGVRHMAERVARGIHTEIPDAARPFLAERRFVVIAWTEESSGNVWSSILTGAPGFAQAANDHAVRIAPLVPLPADPLQQRLQQATVEPDETFACGLLAIDPATRRRMRLNGSAYVQNTQEDTALWIVAEQVYANCPKYIQRREPTKDAVVSASPAPAAVSPRLDARQREWITQADTFFIATAHPEAGADASHRGGNPGFVRVSPDGSTLAWPDYPGNTMFNTLGNIAANPRAGLLFVDFERGATLQITGHAAVLWDAEAVEATAPGAERAVRFSVERVIEHPAGALPLRMTFVDYSPFNPE